MTEKRLEDELIEERIEKTGLDSLKSVNTEGIVGHFRCNGLTV